jgi:hypothetical protein
MLFVFGPIWFVAIVTLLYIVVTHLPSRHLVTQMTPFVPKTAWITYDGVTPPLRLKLCLAGSTPYNAALATYTKAYGANSPEQLSNEDKQRVIALALSAVFIVDWDKGGCPYRPLDMAEILLSDPTLIFFVSDSMKQIAASL